MFAKSFIFYSFTIYKCRQVTSAMSMSHISRAGMSSFTSYAGVLYPSHFMGKSLGYRMLANCSNSAYMYLLNVELAPVANPSNGWA